MTYALYYLLIKQIAISQEQRTMWKNYRCSYHFKSSFKLDKLNFHFMYTLSNVLTYTVCFFSNSIILRN